MSAVERFERRKDEFDPAVNKLMTDLGEQCIEAYASGHLLHNTMSGLANDILKNGLRSENNVGVPDDEDIAWARHMFETKGFSHPDNDRRFKKYIEGRKENQTPGVFFYRVDEIRPDTINHGYGIPERLRMFATEIGGIALLDQYSETEKAKATQLHQKYVSRLRNFGDHVAVLEADPFSPPVINSRILPIADHLQDMDRNTARFALDILDKHSFDGIYVCGSVQPKDLTLIEPWAELPFDILLQKR